MCRRTFFLYYFSWIIFELFCQHSYNVFLLKFSYFFIKNCVTKRVSPNAFSFFNVIILWTPSTGVPRVTTLSSYDDPQIRRFWFWHLKMPLWRNCYFSCFLADNRCTHIFKDSHTNRSWTSVRLYREINTLLNIIL